jgi:hypothetical protein
MFTAENLETVKSPIEESLDLSRLGNSPRDSRTSATATFDKGKKVTTSHCDGKWPRCTTQGLNPFQLLGAIADMPDARAGHDAG